MADIFNHFPIKAPAQKVFDAVSTPASLDAWWTLTSTGEATEGAVYQLGFGPGYDWRAVVTRCVPGKEFEWGMTAADEDWLGTSIGFAFVEADGVTQVKFHHTGWPKTNDHFRISCYCWPMYLRLLRRHIELGEVVPYADRLDV